MKIRLLGAAVLIALAVLFLPMIFSGKSPAPAGDQAVNLAIPPAQDRELQTRTMSLTPDASSGTSSTTPVSSAAPPPATTVAAPASNGQLATVNIGSSRPRDVETDPEAGKPPMPTTVTTGSGASPSQPVIPVQTKPAPVPPVARSKAPVSEPVSRPAVVEPAAVAGHGNYTLNLSAYASASGAATLEKRVRALGYPVGSHSVNQAGQVRKLVIAGPFTTRAGAEAARLKITQSIPGVPARVEQDASHADAATAAAPVAAAAHSAPISTPAHSAARAGGWAVQLAAMSNQADANALRDKLRANGFDGFVDTVQSGGKKLWRVRAGPQTQRADATRLRDQIKAKLGTEGNVVSVP